MKQEIKEKWVKALRSGLYTQGRNVLRRGDSFCCVGVLCDIHREETGEGSWVPMDSGIGEGSLGYFTERGEEEALTTPPSVMDWAGVNLNEATFYLYGYSHRIFHLNDGNYGIPNDEPLTFTQIADLIEEQL